MVINTKSEYLPHPLLILGSAKSTVTQSSGETVKYSFLSLNITFYIHKADVSLHQKLISLYKKITFLLVFFFIRKGI